MKRWTVVLMGLLTLLCRTPAQAESAVWKVTRGDETVYLGGTIHLLRAEDYPLPREFELAYENSDHLVFETDIAAMSTPEGQMRMLKAMAAPPGQRLTDVLTPSTYQLLADALQQRGGDIRMLAPFNAAMAIVSLQAAEFTRLGVSSEGVDQHFHKRAIQDELTTGELESVDDHFAFIASLGRGWEESLVKATLTELQNTRAMFDEMANAWRNGDLQRLDALFIEQLRRDYPTAYRELLVERNDHWRPRIEAMFAEPGTEFVLVGVAHLPGEQGLLAQLEGLGYRVAQVAAP